MRICKECKKTEVGKGKSFCDSCQRIKKLKSYTDWYHHNKAHRTKWNKEYCQTNSYKSNRMLKQYGITLEEYNQMLDKQDHRCAICLKHEDDQPKRLSIDHDHSMSGKESVRGLICNACNKGLGLLGDNADSMQRALDYLTKDSGAKK